ncbi:MAG TPA: hypothetical protein VHW66_06085, partial [Stellaceae bacterium]|nr:hypothetical protein [Stellaceae bacterium]
MNDPSDHAHSAAYIDDSRVDWWDISFIAEALSVLGLTENPSVLDVGAGAGHWTRVIAQARPDHAA